VSLADYKRWRDAWIAGDNDALVKMTRAITPSVADRIGRIEHEAAVERARCAGLDDVAELQRHTADAEHHARELSRAAAELRRTIAELQSWESPAVALAWVHLLGILVAALVIAAMLFQLSS
jgi:hypothetical protein